MFVSALTRREGFPFDPSTPCGFSTETLAAVNDTATGRKLAGPYHIVRDVVVELDER